MIVYFDKKSKNILEWGRRVIWGMLLVYGYFVWTNIIQKDTKTLQIIQSSKSIVEVKSPVQVAESNVIQSASQESEYLFVASSRGKYYYPKTCSRARTLSVQNMLYFKDKISAEAAGYVAHSGC